MKAIGIVLIAIFVLPIIAGEITIFAEIATALDNVNILIAGR